MLIHLLVSDGILAFIRPFYRLARLAKLAGSNARDGLTSHGFMGFGNDSSETKVDNPEENGGSTTSKNGAFGVSTTGQQTAAGKSKWGNLMQVSISFFIEMH